MLWNLIFVTYTYSLLLSILRKLNSEFQQRDVFPDFLTVGPNADELFVVD